MRAGGNISGLAGLRAGIARGLPVLALTLAAFLALPASHAAAVTAPQASTGAAGPGAESWLRVLEGNVIPGSFKYVDCRFEYGPGTGYGASVPCVQSRDEIGTGTSPKPVSAETEPLDPGITYHYRLVVANALGESFGADGTFATAPFPFGPCPNEAIRREQGIESLLFPSCMALEMVSPSHKDGASTKYPNVSANGSRVSFVVQAALGEDPPGLTVGGTLYVAGRGNAGWTPESTHPDADPRFAARWGSDSQLRPSFTPDFSRWLGAGADERQLPQGILRAYEAGVGGFFQPLSEPLQPRGFDPSQGTEKIVKLAEFTGASADHSHLYSRSGAKATYFPGDPTLSGPGAETANVYLLRRDAGGELEQELLNRDREEEVWGGNCGARLGGILRNQGAVSAEGYRTYLSARAAQPQGGGCSEANKLRILERLESSSGPQIVPLFASECSRPALPDPPGACIEADGSDFYQGASLDQTKVYFTTNRQLVDSDVDGSSAECSLTVAVSGCDLYLYDRMRPAGERLVQVSAGEGVPGEHETGKEADVFNGITAISADGSRVYFVATGVLTGATNPEGEGAQLGQPNLYLWDAESEEAAFLAGLHPEDGIADFAEQGRGLWGGEGTWRNGAYPVPATGTGAGGDGHILVFESKAELADADADGVHLDAYRYDTAAETLVCVSCAPGSSVAEPDEAPFDVAAHGEASAAPAGTDFAERGRWVSEDGEAVTLATEQSLLPGDIDGAHDFYLWRDGGLAHLPGTPFAGPTAPPEGVGPFLSHDGSTVAFVTATRLLPQDGDTAADVYVARVGGGYAPPPAPNPCEPGNPSKPCQEPPPPPPATNSRAAGTGNPPPRRRCAKGKVRRRGRCVPRHRRHAGKHRRGRAADTDRRAGK